jgi:hypothetical protein
MAGFILDLRVRQDIKPVMAVMSCESMMGGMLFTPATTAQSPLSLKLTIVRLVGRL